MMHLVKPLAPRFHLHPALWHLGALERCCEISLRNGDGNGSAWHFEKTCEKPDADLPPEWKSGCYQIAAHALASRRSSLRTASTLTERWIFNRLMALAPWLPNHRWAERYFRLLGMDDVFCDGPYPMIFPVCFERARSTNISHVIFGAGKTAPACSRKFRPRTKIGNASGAP